MTINPDHWPRAIALMGMNAFFASVDQRDFPSLLGQPVAITNGTTGSCIITSSYEARAYGVRTGMRLREARLRCPNLIQRPARPEVYARVSTNIMRAIETVCPDIEVFSVDKAFLVIPLVGAFFVDIINAIIIKFFLGLPMMHRATETVLSG